MNITVSKDHVAGMLQKAGNTIPTRTALAALRAIWLRAEGDTITFMATDASVEYTGTCAAVVNAPGLVGVDARNFVELVSKLPAGEVHLHKEPSGNLVVAQGRRKYKLPCVNEEWFNHPRTFPDSSVFMAGDILLESIDRVRHCISTNVAEDYINCLILRKRHDAAEFIGLNGHNMALCRLDNADLCGLIPDSELLIPERYLQFIKKTLSPDEVEIATCGKFLHFRHAEGAERFSLPLAQHPASNLDGILAKATDESTPVLTVHRADLQEALARTAIFNTKEDRCVKLIMERAQMTLAPNSTAAGEALEILDAAYTASGATIAFPSHGLREMLGYFASEQVYLRMISHERPCCITGDDDKGYLAIIMPMKLADVTYYSEEDV